MALNFHSARVFLFLGLLSACVLIICLDTAEAQINYSPGWGKRNGNENGLRPGSPPRGVNFSPGWGKRGMNAASGPGVGLPQQDSPCKSSMDTILHIYKLIQAEAQKVSNCEKFTSE